MSNWWVRFPAMGRSDLSFLKRNIDNSFLAFSRTHGQAIEDAFSPLLSFLIWTEQLLTQTPWPLVIVVATLIFWLCSRSIQLTIGSTLSLLVIGYFGMWLDCMSTIAMIAVSTILCVSIGIPIGILMSASDRFERVVLPIMDLMQTIPAFVYLIPVVMLLGIGKVPGLIAVCIYALPPVIRFTNHGIRIINPAFIEACDAFGAGFVQRVIHVQVPLALPTIFAGINQTIMMTLGMVVVASMIGVRGLGLPVLRAITNQYLAMGLFNGLAIVAVAIIFDRITQRLGQRLKAT